MENVSITTPPPSDTRSYNGFYRGCVIEHGECGTCRIWIPEVHPAAWRNEPKLIPLAEQAQPLAAFGSQSGGIFGGVYTYPAVGSYVWCFFINGNIENPVYFAACANATPSAESDWHNVELSKTEDGLMFHYHLPGGNPDEVSMELFTNNSQRAVKLKVAAKDSDDIVNNEIKIDKNGIEIFTTGRIKMTGQNGIDIGGANVALQADGKVNINAPGSIAVRSPMITADCTSTGDHSGHFLIKYWDRFIGSIKAVTMRYPE